MPRAVLALTTLARLQYPVSKKAVSIKKEARAGPETYPFYDSNDPPTRNSNLFRLHLGLPPNPQRYRTLFSYHSGLRFPCFRVAWAQYLSTTLPPSSTLQSRSYPVHPSLLPHARPTRFKIFTRPCSYGEPLSPATNLVVDDFAPAWLTTSLVALRLSFGPLIASCNRVLGAVPAQTAFIRATPLLVWGALTAESSLR